MNRWTLKSFFILWYLSLILAINHHVFTSKNLKTTCNKIIISLSSTLCMPLLSLATDMEVKIPTDKDNQLVQVAFRDFDLRRFDDSAKEFTLALKRWKELGRPRDEIVSLLKARANVYLDNKEFNEAINDDNEAISLMYDGQKDDGTAKYPEYPDSFVSRALAKEGLGDWEGALEDYNKAISLWGGGRGDGINPFVLTFRGNTLCRLNRYNDAIPDYEAASTIFLTERDIARYSDASANLALALYEVGDTSKSVKMMNDVIRKNPGYSDMHIALAAHSWEEGDYVTALKEWRFACDKISVGCKSYEDSNWLQTVRRWPPRLVTKLDHFRARKIPEKLKGDSSTPLAPNSSS